MPATTALLGSYQLICASSPSLAVLELCYNQFRGSIPPELGSCSMLRVLKLPPSLTNCTNLITIDLKSNNFSGQLAKVNFSKLPNLKTLDLMHNSFSGKIPESIYSCSNLVALRLSSNKFHGQLSEKLGNLKSLSFLSLSNNSITNITSALQILRRSKNLTTLLIGLNFMNETMPGDDGIVGFENLQIGQLRALRSLNFSFNDLTGQIPQSISNLTSLQVLDLSTNNLTGGIPAALNNLHFLSAFNISNNDLEGPIPSGGQFNTFQNSSFDGNPKLCGSMLIHKCGSASPPLIHSKLQHKKGW
uniref:Uncharacterized protein n=1 Tax=Aegilops tauschii subsp. strangulata TaxID=200361 RepID=A0A453ND22_AEGTS